VFFDEVSVPDGALLGPLDGGWSALRPGFALERTLLAAICVGATADILGLCTEYAKQRRAFGSPIGSFQLVADRLVQMRIANEAAAAHVERAAEAIDGGDPEAATLASIAKLKASETYVTATRDGAQVFGGYGFTEEYPIGRHYRDAKYMEIGGGTSEVQKIIVARSMGLM
jgi:alkylation response protein AidB-like acyl-CoA dehydrogenase